MYDLFVGTRYLTVKKAKEHSSEIPLLSVLNTLYWVYTQSECLYPAFEHNVIIITVLQWLIELFDYLQLFLQNLYSYHYLIYLINWNWCKIISERIKFITEVCKCTKIWVNIKQLIVSQYWNVRCYSAPLPFDFICFPCYFHLSNFFISKFSRVYSQNVSQAPWSLKLKDLKHLLSSKTSVLQMGDKNR